MAAGGVQSDRFYMLNQTRQVYRYDKSADAFILVHGMTSDRRDALFPPLAVAVPIAVPTAGVTPTAVPTAGVTPKTPTAVPTAGAGPTAVDPASAGPALESPASPTFQGAAHRLGSRPRADVAAAIQDAAERTWRSDQGTGLGEQSAGEATSSEAGQDAERLGTWLAQGGLQRSLSEEAPPFP